MRREDATKKWTPQQLVYISQLHLTIVMLLTGRIKLVEKEGDKRGRRRRKEKAAAADLHGRAEQKVKELITAYVEDRACAAYADCGRSAGPRPNGSRPRVRHAAGPTHGQRSRRQN